MHDIDELARRIDRLETHVAIRELVSAYAIACDEHDMPRLLSLFAPDATMDSPSKLLVAHGRDGIEAMFIRLFKVRGPGYHWTHDHVVNFDPAQPDEATGLVLSHAETCPNQQGSVAAMRYEDAYRRLDGRWVFVKRVLNFLYYVPVEQYPQVFADPMRITVNGNRIQADYPENLPAWQDFERKHRSAG